MCEEPQGIEQRLSTYSEVQIAERVDAKEEASTWPHIIGAKLKASELADERNWT